MTWTSSSVPYVTPPKPGESDAWTQAGGSSRLLGVEVVDAPDDVRTALELPEGARVVRRSRLILEGGEPMEVATSYWPAEWAEGTALAEPKAVKGGTLRVLADMGRVTATSVEDNTAVLADEHNCPEAPQGAALHVLTRTMIDAAGQPFEHIVMYRWNGEPQRYVLKAD
jgi:GntR family transcriptional regulator